jgi:hypothetical protein
VRIHDGFSFLNEVDILDIRLAEIGSVVSSITIVESLWTFMGVEKDLLWPKVRHRYFSFLPKIDYVVCDTLYDPRKKQRPEYREIFQNTVLLNAMKQKGAPGDWFIISDLDEIPRHHVLTENRPVRQKHRLQMGYFYYRLNLRLDMYVPIPTCIVPRELLSQGWRTLRTPVVGDTLIPNAGWHFTCQGNRETLHQKSASVAGAGERFYKTLNQNLSNPISTWPFFDKLSKVPIETLPLYVQQNEQSFRDRGMLE